MSELRKVWILVSKDLAAEWRSKEILSSTLFFAILVLTVFAFGFEPGRLDPRDFGPGILWAAFLFAAILAMNRLLLAERESGGLEGLMLCPVERTTLYVAKCVSLFLLLAVTAAATLLLFIVFFNVPLAGRLPGLVVVTLLGTAGLSALGTTFAAMAVRTRAREFLLPMLLIPVIVPLLIAVVKSTGSVLRGDGLVAVRGWLELLVAFDAIFLAVGYVTFPAVLEE